MSYQLSLHSTLSIDFGKELLYYSSIMVDWCLGSINYAKSHGVTSEEKDAQIQAEMKELVSLTTPSPLKDDLDPENT